MHPNLARANHLEPRNRNADDLADVRPERHPVRLVRDNVVTSGVGVADLPESLVVDRSRFEGIVDRLIYAKPVKREKVKIAKRKPQQIIPPEE